jgi:acetyl-CoA carboxylase biotin carboxyl carrier protein
MAILGFELEEIARLIALVENQGLEELVVEEAGRRLRIRGPRSARSAGISAPHVSEPEPPPVRARPRAIAPPPKAEGEALHEDQIALTSPMIGVFYRAEKPGAAPLVKVGDEVAVDQTVGIIEAMKVFSEFKAEHAGIVVSIPAQDGQLVQAGTPLMILKRA